MNKPDALTLVIFGASGDLTRRKLMPALYLLYKAGRLPRRFAVLGMARTSYDDDRFRTSIREGLLSFVRPDEVDEKAIQAFLSCLHYLSADPSKPSPGFFMPRRNTIPSLGCIRITKRLGTGQVPPSQRNKE